MKRLMTAMMAVGLLLTTVGSALAQEEEGPRRGPRRGPPPREGARGPQRDRPQADADRFELPPAVKERLEKLSPEQRRAAIERLRKLSPDQRREALKKLMQRGREGAAEARRPGPAGDRQARDRQGGSLLRRYLSRLPAEKRQKVQERLKNATPEDRAKFLRGLAERMRRSGAQRGQDRPGEPGRRGGQARREGRGGQGPWARGGGRGGHGPQARGGRGAGGAHPFLEMLRRMSPERRRQLVARLTNSTPEDRARFFRKFAQRRPGSDAREGGRGRGGRFRDRGERCPHCGVALARRGDHGRRGMMRDRMRRPMLRRLLMQRHAGDRRGPMMQRRGPRGHGGWMRGPMGPGRDGRGFFRGGQDRWM